MALAESKVDIPQSLQGQVFGQFDSYLKKIERTLNVTVISRDGELKIVGAGTALREQSRFLRIFAGLRLPEGASPSRMWIMIFPWRWSIFAAVYPRSAAM